MQISPFDRRKLPLDIRTRNGSHNYYRGNKFQHECRHLKTKRYDSNLESAIDEAMTEREDIKSYDEEKEELIKPYIQQSLESSATSFGMDLEQMAQAFGAEDSESYITQVVTHFEETFPGVVYCWDVVNEAVGDNAGEYKPADARHPTGGRRMSIVALRSPTTACQMSIVEFILPHRPSPT